MINTEIVTEAEPSEEIGSGAINPKQMVALPMLAAGRSYKDVAAELGISAGTIRNWVSGQPAFKSELARLRRELFLESTEMLRAVSLVATQALHNVIVDTSTSARDRVAAAKAVLQFTHDKTTVHHVNSDDIAAASIANILKDWKHETV